MRAARTASVTRAEPLTAAAGVFSACVAPALVGRTEARATATLAVPVAAPLVGAAGPPAPSVTGGGVVTPALPTAAEGDWIGTVNESGGGAIPGAR
ncbi:hypothetical protein GCM10009827_079440 [Dactylosporangium maewongense]|uniref:Uncharacterized protein n=1 Tax=Dactylosporangium maewongense TaxID=634393 RepID=A0ABN2BU41_9ACTN